MSSEAFRQQTQNAQRIVSSWPRWQQEAGMIMLCQPSTREDARKLIEWYWKTQGETTNEQ